jgi:flavin reductase (DIM6/NTAB) family NADH-FMN oxidoreductase RutF
MTFDSALQRKIMGRFATGVTIVTTAGNDRRNGLTANAVTSVSLDPPLVLVAIDKRAGTHAELKQNGCFAISILSADQEEVSRRFATPGPKDFSGLVWKTAVTGAPILEGALGYVDCRVTEVLPGGDHDLFLGRIVAGGFAENGAPLLYYSGKYRRLAE